MTTKPKLRAGGVQLLPERRRWVEKRHCALSAGESVRMAREFQELSQNALARRSGIAQSTISAIEQGQVTLGVERAKRLAKALRVHPAVLLFPDWVEETPPKPRRQSA